MDQRTRWFLESSVVSVERRLSPLRLSAGECSSACRFTPINSSSPPPESSHEDMYGVKCNLKAVQGTLFPLEKSLFFVAKQPHLVEFADIHQVVFSRYVPSIVNLKSH